MSYPVRVDAAAESDLDEAMAWYENQRPGLGIDFLYKFYDAVGYLKENPRQYPEVHAPFRRVLMKKYPYALYYAIEEEIEHVIILAVWHTRQHPDRLKGRLGGGSTS